MTKKREKNRKFPVLNNVNFHCFINVYIGKDQYNSETLCGTTGLLLVSCDLFLFLLNLMQKEQYDLIFKTYRYFPTPVSSAAQQNKVKHSCVFLVCLVCCVMLAQSQKCQTERTAFLCLSPWLGWHSGCGTDGRQLHLSGFLYLLFGNQWLHYRRPVQLHSLAVSWAVCSVCLSACQSFSQAVSNWILAGELIAHCAAFAISFSSLSFSLYLDVSLQSDFFSWVRVLILLDLRPLVGSLLHHYSITIIFVFTDSSAVAHMCL